MNREKYDITSKNCMYCHSDDDGNNYDTEDGVNFEDVNDPFERNSNVDSGENHNEIILRNEMDPL